MPFLSDDLRKLFAVLECSKDWKNSKAAESNQKNSDISHISRGCDDVTWSNGTTNLPTTIWTKEAPTTLQQDHLEWSRQSRKWAQKIAEDVRHFPSQHMHVKCLQYRVLYGTNQTPDAWRSIQDHGVRVRATDVPTFGEGAIGGMPRAGLGFLKAAIGFDLKFIVSTKCTLGDQLRSIIDFHTSW